METSVVQSYNTRSSTSGNFYIRVSNLEIIKKNAFSRIGASLWNEVPSNLRELLSGSLSKSGPLNFGIKNIFPHFLSVKRVWQTYIKKVIYYFPVSYFCFATSQNCILAKLRFPTVIRKVNSLILWSLIRPLKCSWQNSVFQVHSLLWLTEIWKVFGKF